ncbi:hypothetical protein [Sorangium sp. So ce854]|uniref:hypothetical protein n=1 Tax=Sorangium sp. So ce854 TaxID=3133322 RepID=UPI003F5EE4E1
MSTLAWLAGLAPNTGGGKGTTMGLANDLSAAAEMYRRHREAINDDKRSFRGDDEKEASAQVPAP